MEGDHSAGSIALQARIGSSPASGISPSLTNSAAFLAPLIASPSYVSDALIFSIRVIWGCRWWTRTALVA